MLEKIAENIWSVPSPLAVFGFIHLNTRMTVIRLSDGSLWLHSLVPCSEELCKQIEELGTIRYLVAPSCLHHLFVGEWIERYPGAISYGARGLHRKRSDITFNHLLTDNFEASWTEEITRLNLMGVPAANECIFYHRPSQSLIVTDLLFYMPESTGFTKLYAKMWGFYDRLKTPGIFKAAIRDKQAFRQSLRPVFSWNIQYLALCHHSLPKSGELLNEQIQRALSEL